MTKHRILTAALILLLVPALAGAAGQVVSRGPNGTPSIVKGDLGVLNGLAHANEAAIRSSAQSVLEGVLASQFGASGSERMVPGRVSIDELGAAHVRFTQEINGIAVEGAGMVLHAHADGTVFGVNGEFVKGDTLPLNPAIDAESAFAFALGQAGIQGQRGGQTDLTYVRGNDGNGYLAWKTTVDYVSEAGPQRDTIYADAETGNLVARVPHVQYALHLQTYDCHQKTRNCTLVLETPPDALPANTGDAAIDAAHNFAAATYNYYWNNYGRDSIDNNGLTIISRVHYDRNYNNAFWDGTQMTYGDGDGTTFIPLSQDADVVGHELTHGVTESESGLIYSDESGALNESWSDIFGAAVDRQEGATGQDIWFIGEDVYTPNISGDALRNMADPAEFGDRDYYPDRYTGTSDNGGVHTNSGISNLAFQLLVDGGTHPRGKTSVSVTGIGFDAAATIFYNANTDCMTPGSDFSGARYCTADVFGGSHSANVHDAWDAVGVPNNPPPPPVDPVEIFDATPLTGQDGTTGGSDEVQQYFLLGVAASETVTCTTSCNNGDADLYLRFGAEAEPNPSSANNECGSYSSTSNESCTTGPAPSATTLYAAVHAYASYTNLTITCTINGACSLGGPGDPCNNGGDCCSGSCSGGKPGTRTCN